MNKLIRTIQQAGKVAGDTDLNASTFILRSGELAKMRTPALKKFVTVLYGAYPRMVDALYSLATSGSDGIVKYDYLNMWPNDTASDRSIVMRHLVVNAGYSSDVDSGGGILIVDQDVNQLLACTPVEYAPDMMSLYNTFIKATSIDAIEYIRIIDEYGAWYKYHNRTILGDWVLMEFFNPNAVFGLGEGFLIPQGAEQRYQSYYEIPGNKEAYAAFRTMFAAAGNEARARWHDAHPGALPIEVNRRRRTFPPIALPVGFKYGLTTRPHNVLPVDTRLSDVVANITTLDRLHYHIPLTAELSANGVRS